MSRPPRLIPLLLLTVVVAGLTAPLGAAPSSADPWRPPSPVQESAVGGSQVLATNARGDTVAAFLVERPEETLPTRDVVVVRRPAGGSWSAPLVVSAQVPGEYVLELDVDIAADGRALVVWNVDDGTSVQLRVRAVPARGSLGAVRPLGPTADGAAAFRPDVGVSAGGRAVVVWADDEGLVGAAGTVADLASPVPVSDAGGIAGAEIAFSGVGEATIAWERVVDLGGEFHLVETCRWPAGAPACGDVTQFGAENPIAQVRAPDLSVNRAGQAILCFTRTGSYPPAIHYALRPAAGPWGRSGRVAPDLPEQIDGCATTLRQDGSAAVAFQDTDGNQFVATRDDGGFDVRRQLNAPDAARSRLDWADGAAGHTLALVRANDALRSYHLAPASRTISRGAVVPVDAATDWVAADLDDQGNAYLLVTSIDCSGPTCTWAPSTVLHDAAPPSLQRLAAPASGRRGRVVTLRALGVSDRVSSVRVSWRFSDGTTAAGTTVRKTLARVGRLGVTLTLTDAAGRRTVRTASIRVTR